MKACGEKKAYGKRRQKDGQTNHVSIFGRHQLLPNGIKHEDPVFAVVGGGIVSRTSNSPLSLLHPTHNYTESHMHMTILYPKPLHQNLVSSTKMAQPWSIPNQQLATSLKNTSFKTKTSPNDLAALHGPAQLPRTALSSVFRNRRIDSSKSSIFPPGSALLEH